MLTDNFQLEPFCYFCSLRTGVGNLSSTEID